MQSKLPDINAAIVRYRSKALESLDKEQSEAAAICFTAINALLPEDYTIEINTKKYDELIQAKYIIICPSCNKEQPLGKIETFDLLLSITARLITNQKTKKVWKCPNCNELKDYLRSKKKPQLNFKGRFTQKSRLNHQRELG